MFRCGPTALGYSCVLNEIAIAVPVVLLAHTMLLPLLTSLCRRITHEKHLVS